MKQIPLTQGKVALVSDHRFDYLCQWVWYAKQDLKNGKWYAASQQGGKKNARMHRVIMNAPKGMKVDHKDGDGLNNQDENLRICTHAQNLSNRGKQKNNTTGFKGVQLNRGKYFVAQMRISGKTTHIGTFDTAEAAAQAYDAKARELHGEFAKLNFEGAS